MADKADKWRRQDALAKEQCCHNANKRRLQDALAIKQRRHEVAACNAALVELALAEEQGLRESAENAVAVADNALATEQRRQESAECAAVTVENALAAMQCRQESAKRAAATAEKALANEVDEQRCQEEAAHASALADMALAKERCCHEMATTAAMVAEKAIAQLAATLAEMASTAEQGCHEAATQEKALADKANKRCRAAALEKRWPTTPTNNIERPRRRKRWQTRPTSNAGPPRGTKLANEANKQRCHKSTERATTSATKALVEDEHNKDKDDVARQIESYAAPFFARIDVVMAKIRALDDGFGNWAAFGDDILAEEDNKASDLTMPPSAPPTAMSPPPHRPTMYKDAVLSTMGGSLCAKSLVVAPLSRPSTTVDGQLQMACRRSRPRRRVGRRHGPRAPNPQEHPLHGRQHWLHAPNQSTEDGWA